MPSNFPPESEKPQPVMAEKVTPHPMPPVAMQAETGGSFPVVMPEVTDEIRSICQTHKLGAAGEQQRLVYALLVRTLFEYRSDRITLVVSIFMIPFVIAFGMLLGFAAAAALGWLLSFAGLGDVLVMLAAGLVFLLGVFLRKLALEADIRLDRSEGKLIGLKLGRLEEMFQIAGPATIGLFLGLFFGVQHAVLMFTPSHVGLPIEGNLGECFWITLDNALHGVFLDTFELYGIHLGERLDHTFYSATIFYAFRIAFDAMVFLIGYALWKRYRLARFFSDFPRDQRDVPGVMSWITRRCEENEARRYHDEIMFLVLCKAFISGDFDFVRNLSSNLSALQVSFDVRRLFRTTEGEVLFLGSHE